MKVNLMILSTIVLVVVFATSCASLWLSRSSVPDTGSERDSAKEFKIAGYIDEPKGIWSDGTTMWVADEEHEKLFAYTLATGTSDSTKDFHLVNTFPFGNDWPQGIWSDGTTMWVAEEGWDGVNDKLYAYTLSNGDRVRAKEFNLASGNIWPRGIWSDGTTMWVADGYGRKLYAYTLATGARDTAKEFNLADGTSPQGIWSDGTTMWIVHPEFVRHGITSYPHYKIHAYTLASGARNNDKDFDLAGTAGAFGIWSDGTTMWVVALDFYSGFHKLYAYVHNKQ